MSSNLILRKAIGKALAAGIAAYIGLFGLPGMVEKDHKALQDNSVVEHQQQILDLQRVVQDLFGRSVAQAEGPEELQADTDKDWKTLVKEGETPVGSIIDGAYIEDGQVKEENHPLPDLSGYEKLETRRYAVLDEVPGKETKIVKYEEKGNPQHQIWVGYYGDKVACYFHSNPAGDDNWGGRGTYDPDRNFEQKQGTEWPDFWHDKSAFFPEHFPATDQE